MWSSMQKAYVVTGTAALLGTHLLSMLLEWQSGNVHLSTHLTFLLAEIWFVRNVILRLFTSPFRHLPSAPDELFLFGHTPWIILEGRVYRFFDWMQRVPNEGLLRLSGAGFVRNGLLITRPELAWQVLVQDSHKFEKPPQLRKWLDKVLGGVGLIAVEGKAHATQRRGLARAFTNTSMRQLVPLLWKKSTELADEVMSRINAQRGDQAMLDMSPISAGVTLDIISIALFGKDMACLKDADEPLQRDWGFITNPACSNGRLTNFFVLNLGLPEAIATWLGGKFGKQFHAARSRLRELCHTIITERRSDPELKDKVDILSLMIADEHAFMNDAELIDQLLTFLAAGHDTTSGAFLWSLWLLSEHTDVQARIREEVNRVLAEEIEDGKPFDSDTLDKMTYTSAAASEVLRLYPTVPVTPRVATDTVVLNGVVVPKGTRVYMSTWALQRMQDVWGSDAMEFRPERWLEDEEYGGASAPHAFVTFIHGPRSCLGQHLARNELRCLIAAVICKLEFLRPQPNLEMSMTGIITSQPSRGMTLSVKKKSVKCDPAGAVLLAGLITAVP